ncbi:MAG: hypothetical protein JNN27_10880, partial [Planctomycetes bacterium]|nr:hypothetical protein [Planctomycetota bacterium]
DEREGPGRGVRHVLARRGVRCADIDAVAQEAISREVFGAWPGRLDSRQIRALASESAARSGGRFDERRWFLGDDELFHEGEKTYTLTNQWGWRSLQPFFDACRRAFPDAKVEARAVGES